MLNVAIALAGKSIFFNDAEYVYPKPLIEIRKKIMIQLVLENLRSIRGPIKFTFILKREDCARFHLDDTLRLLAGDDGEIVVLEKETKGAICSILMSIDSMSMSDPLLVVNGDQVFDIDLNEPLGRFERAGADAGVVCFDSVHPRWSFARLDEAGKVVEAAEKRPISRNAIAGFYYFRTGDLFVKAAMDSIRRDASIDGVFYTSTTLNEIVLGGGTIEMYQVPVEKYHTFYNPQGIKEYEARYQAYGSA